jgi:hypothetical protein
LTAVPVRWLTVFLDFPAASFGAGVAFWSALIGWEGQDGGRSALPVRIELRRAGLDDRVTGHLAFACADLRAVAARHAAAGARILAVLPRETEMADPVGRFYRLTGLDGPAFGEPTVQVEPAGARRG